MPCVGGTTRASQEEASNFPLALTVTVYWETIMASANLYAHPAAFPPMPAVARVPARFDRPELEGFITVAIGLLDVMDGDSDLEPNGDEEDSTLAEDEAGAELHARLEGGPGCPIGDPDCGIDDLRHDGEADYAE